MSNHSSCGRTHHHISEDVEFRYGIRLTFAISILWSSSFQKLENYWTALASTSHFSLCLTTLMARYNPLCWPRPRKSPAINVGICAGALLKCQSKMIMNDPPLSSSNEISFCPKRPLITPPMCFLIKAVRDSAAGGRHCVYQSILSKFCRAMTDNQSSLNFRFVISHQ